MIYKKSVVLSSANNSSEKGVLTLEYDGGEMIGNVRLYNFSKLPEGILSLGILHDGSVLKAGLTQETESFYTFKLNGGTDLNTFSCAVVNLKNGEAKPILLGSTNGTSAKEESLTKSFCIYEKSPTVENVQQVLDENDVYLEDQEEIDEYIENALNNSCDAKCSECKYRDAFFKQEDVILEEPLPEKEETFYDGIKEQIDLLFANNPQDDILKQIIPNSKWVKIDYEEKNEYYVVGLIYENDKIKYVCYGVPSVFTEDAPEDLKGFSQWLPIDTQKQTGFGYWLTYQDAETGENVKLDFEVV